MGSSSTSPQMRRLARFIEAERTNRDWSQPELAKRLGYSQRYVSKVENLGGKSVSMDFLLAVARVFDVSPMYFLVDGPVDLDANAFRGPVDRQIEALQRQVAALMLAVDREPEPDEGKPGSGPRPLSRPPSRPPSPTKSR